MHNIFPKHRQKNFFYQELINNPQANLAHFYHRHRIFGRDLTNLKTINSLVFTNLYKF